jgi:16S rRNA (guanine527-N7)-methyltransferase
MLNRWTSEGILTPATAEKLNTFLDLLFEWNTRVNLTGLHSRSEMEEILVGESLLAARALPISGKRVLDVGSGAGVPGLLWAIYDPTMLLTSLEVRQKKVAFQKEAQRILGLNVEVVRGMFPAAVVSGRSFDIVVTRAVRYTPTFEEEAVSLLLPGGTLVRFAGANAVVDGWSSLNLSPRASMLIRQI